MKNKRKMEPAYILLFTQLHGHGGIPAFGRNFLQALMQAAPGSFFYTLCLNDRSPFPNLTRNNKAKFICFGSRFRFLSKIKFVLVFFSIVAIQKLQRRTIKIICGHINLAPLCLIGGKMFRFSYVVITYGIEVWHIKNRLRSKAITEANIIIAISQYTLKALEKQIKSISNKTFVLPCAVSGETFVPAEKSKHLLQKYRLHGCKILLTIARMDANERYKGYDKVIMALPKVLKHIPNAKYVLVGTGTDVPRIKSLVKKLNLEDHVIFTGFVPNEEIVDHYNLCDVFVMPSKGEGFGIVFLEALACGKPVIAGNKDGSRDALLDGDLGLLVDPDNVDEIAEAIINVLKGNVPSHLLKGDYLRQTVLKYFGPEAFYKRVLALLERL
ncbi:glycosyltransferase family 4 protein [Candidatus Bipolaricaulota sp. J31]